MTLQNIFSSNYLFNSDPLDNGKFYVLLTIIFSLIIVMAIVTRFIRGDGKKIAGRYFTPFLIAGILGLIYLFTNYESLPLFGSRFVGLVAFLIIFITIVVNTIWAIRFIPKFNQEKEAEKRYRKYLPKSKN